MAYATKQPIGDLLGLIGLRDEPFPELFEELLTYTEERLKAQEEAHKEDQLTESEKRAIALAQKLSKGRM